MVIVDCWPHDTTSHPQLIADILAARWGGGGEVGAVAEVLSYPSVKLFLEEEKKRTNR